MSSHKKGKAATLDPKTDKSKTATGVATAEAKPAKPDPYHLTLALLADPPPRDKTVEADLIQHILKPVLVTPLSKIKKAQLSTDNLEFNILVATDH